MTMTNLTPEQLALAARILSGTDTDAEAVQRTGTVDVADLIATTRSKLGFQPIAKPGTIEASDPAAVKALVAWADDLADQEKSAKEQREAIKDILKGLVGAAEEQTGESIDQLTVAGKKVFSWSTTTTRVLDQAAVKRMFPDIPEHAEFWKTQVTRTARF